MGYRKNVNRLKKFLRDNKVLTRFRLNCRNCSNGFTGIGYALDTKNKHYSIGDGFIWADTPEGHKFWAELERKFTAPR